MSIFNDTRNNGFPPPLDVSPPKHITSQHLPASSLHPDLLHPCGAPSQQTGESLVELVKAVMWSAGPVAEAAKTGQHTRPAELCLELLVALALRNRCGGLSTEKQRGTAQDKAAQGQCSRVHVSQRVAAKEWSAASLLPCCLVLRTHIVPFVAPPSTPVWQGPCGPHLAAAA